MILKQQIEATIKAYEEACKLKNLNIEYCRSKNLNFGICNYSEINKFTYLYKISPSYFLCETPFDFHPYNSIIFKIKTYKAHKKRISYLKKLLKDYEN